MAECMRSVKTPKKPLETYDVFHSTISTETGVFFYVEWKIFDYFLLPLKEDLGITSPNFQFKNAEWHLLLYPRGRLHLDNTQYLDLSLLKESSPIKEHHVNFNIGIRGNADIYESWNSEKKFIGDGASWGKHTFLYISDLELDKRELAPDGAVTFFCYLQDCSDRYSASQKSSVEGLAARPLVRMPLKFTENLHDVYDRFHTEIFTDTRAFFYVEWRVFNILLPLKGFISPRFQYKNAVWHLHLYPRGRVRSDNTKFLDLSLVKEYSSIKAHPVNFIIGMRKKDDIYTSWSSEKTFIGDGSSSGMHTFLVSSGIKHDKRVFAPDGALTLFCYLQDCCIRPSASQKSTLKDTTLEAISAQFPKISCESADKKSSNNQTTIPDTTLEEISALKISCESADKKSSNNQTTIPDTTLEAISALKISCESADNKSSNNQTTVPAVSVPRSSNASILGQAQEIHSTSAAVSVPRSSNASILGQAQENNSSSAAVSVPRSYNASILGQPQANHATSAGICAPRSSNTSISGHTMSNQSTSSTLSLGRSSNANTFDRSACNQSTSTIVTFESLSNRSTSGHSGTEQLTSPDLGFGSSSNTRTSGSPEYNPWSYPGYLLGTEADLQFSRSSKRYQTLPRVFTFGRSSNADTFGRSVSIQSTSKIVTFESLRNRSTSGHSGTDQSISSDLSFGSSSNTHTSGSSEYNPWSTPGYLLGTASDLQFSRSSERYQTLPRGLGSQLLREKMRLNDDLTPKELSKPITRVDETAYRHDASYLRNTYTTTRNEVCGPTIRESFYTIRESYPTIRERFDTGISMRISSSEQTFRTRNSSCISMFCLKCQEKTGTKNYHKATSKNRKPMGKGNCNICDSKKATFLPQKSRRKRY